MGQLVDKIKQAHFRVPTSTLPGMWKIGRSESIWRRRELFRRVRVDVVQNGPS